LKVEREKLQQEELVKSSDKSNIDKLSDIFNQAILINPKFNLIW
jgi:hypothetical protein